MSTRWYMATSRSPPVTERSKDNTGDAVLIQQTFLPRNFTAACQSPPAPQEQRRTFDKWNISCIFGRTAGGRHQCVGEESQTDALCAAADTAASSRPQEARREDAKTDGMDCGRGRCERAPQAHRHTHTHTHTQTRQAN